MTSMDSTDQYSFFEKIIIRFFSLYFFFYTLATTAFYTFYELQIPFIDELGNVYLKGQTWLIGQVGTLLFGIQTINGVAGADIPGYYISLLVYVILAIIGTVVWPFVRKKKINHQKLAYWSAVIIRLMIIMVLVIYGVAKVLKSQFPYPMLHEMIMPFGDMYPMDLTWKYMGHSPAYNLFTGLGEVIGALLLIHRRTTLLGACILVAVMSNVLMINLYYDVFIKIRSFHLLLAPLYLIWLDRKRILDFFIFNRPTDSKDLIKPFTNKKLNLARVVLKIVFVSTILIDAYDSASNNIQRRDNSPIPPIYGVYNIEQFIYNKDTIPPLTTDTIRWHKMIFDKSRGRRMAIIMKMDGELVYYPLETDTLTQTLTLYASQDSTLRYEFSYNLEEEKSLDLKGTFSNDSIEIKTHFFDVNEMNLRKQGFHWTYSPPHSYFPETWILIDTGSQNGKPILPVKKLKGARGINQTHSATKRLVSRVPPLFLLEEKTRCFPSFENTGKASKVSS